MSEILATYLVETTHPTEALQALCRGQSVGNPTILTPYETKAFLDQWAARGLWRQQGGAYVMTVRFPQGNFGTEGLNYLLSVLLGGQCDVDLIQGCRLMRLELGRHRRHLGTPRFGTAGLRRLLGVQGRALVGGILKPKIGLSPLQVADVVKQMADGGCDVIKEDEILADQYWCPMTQRLPLVKKALEGYQILYLACVTGDGSEAWVKARCALRAGAGGVHLNIWAGLGTYLDVWRHLSAPIHFQKSGDKVWTQGAFSLDARVLYQLAHVAGCDLAHVGMYGGYLAESVGELQERITALETTLPSFSCGMTPPRGAEIIRRFGEDVLLLSGGWVHGQPQGVTWACQQLRKVADASRQAVPV